MTLDTSALYQTLPQTRGYHIERMRIGESGLAVYRLLKRGRPAMFVKVSTPGDASELRIECDCLNWLARRTSVPTVLQFVTNAQGAFLLTAGLRGTNALGAPPQRWSRIVEQLAGQLRRLHSLDPQDCPFDRTLDRVIPLAVERAASGQVEESSFDSQRIGCGATELGDSLNQERPQSEDIVVVHGDACLDNMIFDEDKFSGFVDCGRCGRADRYQDLALAHRSINGTYGSRYAEAFLHAYGLDHVDTGKLSYYRLLDEFF